MADLRLRRLLGTFTLAAAIFAGPAAIACDGAGVITRIEGRPQDVIISRTEAGQATVVNRPRVLEVVCRGDVVHVVSPTYVVLAIDGAGPVRVDPKTPYTIPSRSGAPTMAGNAYRNLADNVMPDMKRLAWNVRLKGAGDDFGFALPSLVGGGQKIQAGQHALLVRLVGGTAPYRVELTGGATSIALQTSDSHAVLLPRADLTPGAYTLKIRDSTPRELEATFTVVDTPPPADTDYAGLSDPEIRIAAAASDLARNAPEVWSFEAEQQLAAAPANGLDRDKVYELIESYGGD